MLNLRLAAPTWLPLFDKKKETTTRAAVFKKYLTKYLTNLFILAVRPARKSTKLV